MTIVICTIISVALSVLVFVTAPLTPNNTQIGDRRISIIAFGSAIAVLFLFNGSVEEYSLGSFFALLVTCGTIFYAVIAIVPKIAWYWKQR